MRNGIATFLPPPFFLQFAPHIVIIIRFGVYHASFSVYGTRSSRTHDSIKRNFMLFPLLVCSHDDQLLC
jgi:hypothetical protein